MNCPGSVALTATLPNTSSEYAAEGTLAHTLAEELLTGKSNTLMLYERIGDVHQVDGHDIEITEEMVGHVEDYRDAVAAIFARLNAERKLNGPPIVSKTEVRLSGEHIDPRLFGTGDHLMYVIGLELHFFDLKYGKTPVEVADNEQLLTYAAMAMDDEAVGWNFKKVFLHIFQPRAKDREDALRTWETTPGRVSVFKGDLEKATKAAKSEPGAPLVSGDWCQSSFCPALKAGCVAAHEAMTKQAQVEFSKVPVTPAALPSADVMPIEQVAQALKWAETFETAFKGYAERIQRELEAGKLVPGWKLVMGRAGNRQWRDEAEVIAKFDGVVDVYEKPKLKSPAQLEAVVGKKAGVDGLTYKPEGKLRLAQDSDPRTSTSASDLAAKEFTALPHQVSKAPAELTTACFTGGASLEEELGLAPKSKTIWPT